MKRNYGATLVAAVACLGTLLPTSAFADPNATLAIHTTDVALRPGGLLIGQVVDQQGAPKAGAVVAVQYAGHDVVRTTSDANGVFAAKGLRGGQYQLVTSEGQGNYRFWAADTAPPAAEQTALVVADNRVVRGQFGYNPVGDWVEWMKAHPYLTAGTIAAAIAVPLALSDDWSSGS